MPHEAIGPDRTDLFNTSWYGQCGTNFDYDDDDAEETTEPSHLGTG